MTLAAIARVSRCPLCGLQKRAKKAEHVGAPLSAFARVVKEDKGAHVACLRVPIGSVRGHR